MYSLIAVAAVGWGVGLLCWFRSPRRWPRNISVTLLALILSVAAIADTVNAHFGYLPTFSDVSATVTGDRNWISLTHLDTLPVSKRTRAGAHGAVVRMSIPADPAHGFGRTTAIAYLPPQYFTNRRSRFPIVYLMHGSPGKPSDWFHGGQAGATGLKLARAGRPMVLVAPQLSHTWTDDPECVDGQYEQVESHFFQVVVPSLEPRLPVVSERSDRIFAGLSAGGYCALNLGLRHWRFASTIIDLSGDTKPTHAGGMRALFGPGPAAQSRAAANSPQLYVSRMSRPIPLRIWLDDGDDDHKVLREMTAIMPQLRQHGITVELHRRDGGHTFYVWVPALQQALDWAAGGLW